MSNQTSLFTHQGQRKYLTVKERERFFVEAAKEELRFFTFCLVLCLTGCRVSEALALMPGHVDADESCVRFRTLKRRKDQPPRWRSVPVPDMLLVLLQRLAADDQTPLFSWHRSTAWRRVKSLMARAGIDGAQSCPKAFRHYFGVQADAKAIPQPILMRWMGHAKIESSEIYRQAVGKEETLLAERLCWLTPNKERTHEPML